MTSKEELRKKGMDLLSSIPKSRKITLAKQISNHVFQTKWWKEATIIGITISTRMELNTAYIIEQAWKEGKIVSVPKCYPQEDHLMKFYQINSYDQLEKGYANIFEPNSNRTTLIHKSDINLLFVPGILFDRDGYRIGFGGGYYDRYLSNFDQTTISMAITGQVNDHVLHEDFDLPIQHIVTEHGVLF